jgi:hypothetical protein
MRTERDIWQYRSGLDASTDLTGFSIEALDGGIGKVDECTNETTGSFLVVDTGPWIFGKKVMLPSGVVDRVDLDTETVFVNRTKDEIKNAPEFDEHGYRDDAYRSQIGGYYAEGGHGYREQRSSSDQL